MTPLSSTSMLSCQNIWKIFGRTPERVLRKLNSASPHDTKVDKGHVVAVRDVSFDVRKGETFVVMGLSGSGKSTLIRCISRLSDPTDGRIMIDGQDILKMKPNELRELRRHKVSMVFQNFGLFPHRRVIDNVAYGLEVRGIPKKERLAIAAEMIELVGLAGWEHHFPRQLSGGMQQRVGLARALAVKPDILLYDEPFSALDPLIRREMQDELLRLQSSLHKTSIFITHDFVEALKLGDRIAIMRNGEFVQVGTPQELVLNPSNDYVKAFVKDAPRAKVLTAASVMYPGGIGFTNIRQNVPGSSSLEEVLPLLSDHDQPMAVVNDAGAPIGMIDRKAVLRALTPID